MNKKSNLAIPPYTEQNFYDVLDALEHWHEDDALDETVEQTGLSQKLIDIGLHPVDLVQMFEALIEEIEGE